MSMHSPTSPMHPDVSVVIATRDRPASLARLLQCVKSQDFPQFECIVVDDASPPDTLKQYDALWQTLDERFRLLTSETQRAQGPSAARNRGIKAASAPLVAFCDDDDVWIRSDHLGFAVKAMQQHGADLFFANMQTSSSGKVLGPDFYRAIRHILTRTPVAPDSRLFEVPPDTRASAMQHMFLHCDSLVVSRHLLHHAGGYWEKLTMAEDRDLSLRLLDGAAKVLYRDEVVADYDRTAQVGLCKTYSEDEIRQFVILAMLHAESSMRSPVLRRIARGYRAWMLVELAEGAAQAGQSAKARELSRQSLFLRPTWAAARLLAGFGRRTAVAVERRSEAP